MKRYQIIAIHPEDEAPSFHVFDEALQIEIAILDSKEQAELFRNIRLAVDGSAPRGISLPKA